MKLCKDCKHVSAVAPLIQLQIAAWGNHYDYRPMCQHPNAIREPVMGRSIEACSEARKSGSCGPEANLFEGKPAPEPAPDAGSIVYVQPQEDIKLGWIARLFGLWL